MLLVILNVGGIKFDDLLRDSPICQIEVLTKVSSYTVIANTSTEHAM